MLAVYFSVTINFILPNLAKVVRHKKLQHLKDGETFAKNYLTPMRSPMSSALI
jgi:hypothetical protein